MNKLLTNGSTTVLCVGNALIDISVQVDEAFLQSLHLRKGTMQLCDRETAETHLEAITNLELRTLPGGSAANVARGIGTLGGNSCFFGSVGDDYYGGFYKDALAEHNVQNFLQTTDKALSGFAIAYITPDHERTFVVHLGAATFTLANTISNTTLNGIGVLHLEGYLLEDAGAPRLYALCDQAKKQEVLISIDLNDASLIERQSETINSFISQYAGLVFVNEEEAAAHCGFRDSSQMIEWYRKQSYTTVLKCGADGAFIIADGAVISIAAQNVAVVDTTGAGDLFAAGFLYGITTGQDFESAGALGADAAAKIIQSIGVDLTSLANS